MDEAFAVVAHPQLWVAIGALMLLCVVVVVELTAASQVWRRGPQPASVDGLRDAEPASQESYDWLYE
jgi:hypothetical protein